jgi:hypothetical protein
MIIGEIEVYNTHRKVSNTDDALRETHSKATTKLLSILSEHQNSESKVGENGMV